MSRFVLDASVALAWFVDNPLPPYARAVREALVTNGGAVVPALWHLEMANGLANAERQRLLNSDDLAASLSNLEQLAIQAIETDIDSISIRAALNTARRYDLSSYDGVYLDLARKKGILLATLDKKLRTAAEKAGVELMQ